MLRWSQTQLLAVLGGCWILFAEVTSWLFSDGSTCLVNPVKYGAHYADSNECPPLHAAFFKTTTAIFAALEDPNWVIAIATVVTAVFTVVLGTFTVSLAKSTRIAAQAAKDTADAATAIEFPVVRTSWMGPELMATDELIRPRPQRPYGGQVNVGWPTQYSVVGEVEFRNYGRSPAFAESISFGIAVANRLPETPLYTTTVPCPPNSVIAAAGNIEIEADFGFELTEAERATIQAGDAILWFFGSLVFQDIMGRAHNTGFCWQWGRTNEADDISYFFDEGNAPPCYTRKT